MVDLAVNLPRVLAQCCAVLGVVIPEPKQAPQRFGPRVRAELGPRGRFITEYMGKSALRSARGFR
jgi:hypothetical protein